MAGINKKTQQNKTSLYKINIDEICHAIEKFNSNPALLAGDYLTAQHFRKKKILDEAMIPASVVLIDTIWRTQLFHQPKAVHAISRVVGDNWDDKVYILKKPSCLSVDNIVSLINSVISIKKEGVYRNYSFATKFFHWYAPDHFPIVDRRARIGINGFQLRQNIPMSLRISKTLGNRTPDRIRRDYRRHIEFYSELRKSMTKEQLRRLADCDKTTQAQCNATYVIDNTFLRIMDKYFYVRGGGKVRALESV